MQLQAPLHWSSRQHCFPDLFDFLIDWPINSTLTVCTSTPLALDPSFWSLLINLHRAKLQASPPVCVLLPCLMPAFIRMVEKGFSTSKQAKSSRSWPTVVPCKLSRLIGTFS